MLIVLTAAAFPNYLLSQRQRYAKEGWDYSDVADLISAQAAPGDCLLVDNTVGWLPGPVRALLAARPAAYRPLVDVGRGVPAAKRETLWDGHVAVWLVVGRLYKCTTLWTISTHDTKLPEPSKRDIAAARTDAGARTRLHDREKCRVPHRRALAIPPNPGRQVDPLTPAHFGARSVLQSRQPICHQVAEVQRDHGVSAVLSTEDEPDLRVFYWHH